VSDQGGVDLLHQGAETGLHHAMELDALAGGDAQGVVAVLRGEGVEDLVLGAGQDATGDASPDHEHEVLGDLALIAVVLLVDAVELEELLVIGRERLGIGIGKGGGDIAGQGGNVGLEDLVPGHRFDFLDRVRHKSYVIY